MEARIKEELLQVLAIYTGEDEALWLEHRDELPKSWQVVMADGGIDGYDLSAMPAIYLLDADKKVMMHNPTVPQLSALLESLWQNP